MTSPIPQGNEDINNVRVCIRVRPMQPFELENGDSPCLAVLPDQKSIRITNQVDAKRKVETQQIMFDQCFNPHTNQMDFFSHSGCEAFCDKAIDGYATTVFCFGQTGSGKTYTMSGPMPEVTGTGRNSRMQVQEQNSDINNETMGMQYRGAHYICHQVNEILAREGENAVVMKASYIEIYNEHVNDLLGDSQNLKVRWSQKAQSFFIESLMIVTCDGIDDVLAVLEEGANNRKRASHKLNHDSSRSHVLFTLYFERRVNGSLDAPVKLGKINFVDLAGSEKLRDSESTGNNATETKSINKSLFALGNVIQVLASGNAAYVPYRDSTLTKLLMDSLGGSCTTLMIACVTPSSRFADESLRTLKYASRTSSIVNSLPTVRVDPQQQQLYEIKMELDVLRRENRELKNRLEAAGLSTTTLGVMPKGNHEYGHANNTTNTSVSLELQKNPMVTPTIANNQTNPYQQPQQPNPTALSRDQPIGQNFSRGSSVAPPPMATANFQQHEQLQPPPTAGSSISQVMARGPSGGQQQQGRGSSMASNYTANHLMPQQRPPSTSSSALMPLPQMRTPESPMVGNRHHLNADQLAALEIAERVKLDNDRLRNEVAQLRDLILQTRERAASPQKGSTPMKKSNQLESLQQQQQQQNEEVPPSASSSLFGGFRPAPKRATRLNILPMAEAGGTINSSASAPVIPTTNQFERTHQSSASLPPTFQQRNPPPQQQQQRTASTEIGVVHTSNPFRRPAQQASASPQQEETTADPQRDEEMHRMRNQLQQAQRELFLMRASKVADAKEIEDDGTLSVE